MSKSCKELEDIAKQSEKEDPERAIEIYREAAMCFQKEDDSKHRNSNLNRAAKLLQQLGRDEEDPELARPLFEGASSLYYDIGKDRDGDKSISEANKKFIDAAKQLRKEARKMSDLEAAEIQLSIASHYFMQVEDKEESNQCWIDSGDKYQEEAMNTDDPVVAHELFNRAIENYRNGESLDKETSTIAMSASKFYDKANEIHKDNKNLTLAYYYFTQSVNLALHMGNPEKQVEAEEKVSEVREIIGMPDDILQIYLGYQDLEPVSILQEFIGRIESETRVPTIPEREQRRNEKNDGSTDKKSVTNLISNKDEVGPITTPSDEVTTKPSIDEIVKVRPNETIREKVRQEFLEGRKTDFVEVDPVKDLELNSILDDTLSQPVDEIFDPNKGSTEAQLLEQKSGENADSLRGHSTINPELISIQQRNETENVEIFDRELEISSTLTNNTDVETVELRANENIAKSIMKKNPDFTLPPSIVAMLERQGYLKSKNEDLDFNSVPEYETLSLIAQNHPISLEDIESETSISYISMVLSNLSADGLIEQTNDYLYTITQVVEEQL